MSEPSSGKSSLGLWIQIVVIALIVLVGYFTQSKWMPHAEKALAWIQNQKDEVSAPDDSNVAAPTVDTVVLTPAAAKNIGLELGELKLSSYTKTVPVPAIVAQWPGRSQVEITTPMTGVVTHVYSLERRATKPGDPLFDIRLTHEDVVTAQSSFLTGLQKRDVIDAEVKRLQNVGHGIVPGKRIIEQKYKLDEANAALAASRQSLLLHGFSQPQIDQIEKTRKVLTGITVVAPPYPSESSTESRYHVQSIKVNRGQSVDAGDLLSVLANYQTLYVEGSAFEDDAAGLIQAMKSGEKIRVKPFFKKKAGDSESDLKLSVESIADQVDRQSRVLRFYMLLPNEIVHDSSSENKSFIIWKYRPGQRMEVRIPASQTFSGHFILPPSAVALDGPNAFVFEQNGDGFDRVDVHVIYRNTEAVVVEKDPRLIGSVIAMKGAYDLNLTLKNASGGAIDPHAGHNH